MEFGEILEISVLIAIAIELFALYQHTKLDERMNEHILQTDERLIKADTVMQLLDRRMGTHDEHVIRLDQHMNTLDKNMQRLDDHIHALIEEFTQNFRRNRILERTEIST